MVKFRNIYKSTIMTHTMALIYSIDESVLKAIEEEYKQESALDVLIGDGSLAEREELNTGLINVISNPREVAYAFNHIELGPGKTLIDLGTGYGMPLVIGHLMGADVKGPELVAANAQVAWQKFDALREKGISVPPYDAIEVGKNIEDYDISQADAIFAFLAAQKQSETVKRFYFFAKGSASLIIYRPVIECYQTVLNLSLGAPFAGSHEHPFMIIKRH